LRIPLIIVNNCMKNILYCTYSIILFRIECKIRKINAILKYKRWPYRIEEQKKFQPEMTMYSKDIVFKKTGTSVPIY